MKMPKKGTRRHDIVMGFVKSGAMTCEQFVDKYSMLGIANIRKFKNELSELRVSGVLTRKGDVYSPNVTVWEPVATVGDVVEPRTPKPFEELNKKYFTPTVSPRGQEIREISFIGLGASIVEPNRY